MLGAISELARHPYTFLNIKEVDHIGSIFGLRAGDVCYSSEEIDTFEDPKPLLLHGPVGCCSAELAEYIGIRVGVEWDASVDKGERLQNATEAAAKKLESQAEDFISALGTKLQNRPRVYRWREDLRNKAL